MPTAFVMKSCVEVLLLCFIAYWLILLARETRALRVLRGLLIIAVIWLVTVQLELGVLKVVFEGVDMGTVMVISAMILFTPEIKEALARLGGRRRFREEVLDQQLIQDIVRACHEMSAKNVGALIVLQRHDGLGDIVGTGVPLDSKVTAPFIEQVFYPKSPLHDGALVISGQRAVAGRCTLPMSSSPELAKGHLGMRHRAGVGLAEVRDSVTIIVSEERGAISYCEKGRLERDISSERLGELLEEAYSPVLKEGRSFHASKLFLANLQYKIPAFAVALAIWSFNTEITSTTYDLVLAAPELADEQADLVMVTNATELRVEDARIQARNYNILRLAWSQMRDPNYLASQLRVTLPSDVLDREPDSLSSPVVDRSRRFSILQQSSNVPLRLPVKLRYLERFAVPKELKIRTVGQIPLGYRSTGAPLVEHSLSELLCYRGNRSILETAINSRLEIDPPFDQSQLTTSLEAQPIRVLLPASPPEVRELFGDDGFDATVTYIVLPEDRLRTNPRLEELIRIKKELAGRKDQLEEVRTELAPQIAALAEKLTPGARELVTLDGYEQVRQDLEVASARLRRTQRKRSDAYASFVSQREKSPAPAAEDVDLERQILRASDDVLTFDQQLVDLYSGRAEAYRKRIQPVLDLRKQTELVEQGLPELREHRGEVLAAVARAIATKQLTEAESRAQVEHRAFLTNWALRPPLKRASSWSEVVEQLIPIDPLDEDYSKKALQHQARVLDLIVGMREQRRVLDGIWARQSRVDGERFPELSRWQLHRDRARSEQNSLELEIAVAELELDRDRFVDWSTELRHVQLFRRDVLDSVRTVVARAHGSDRIREALESVLPATLRSFLLDRLNKTRAFVANQLAEVAQRHKELTTTRSDLQAIVQRLDDESEFLALRLVDFSTIDRDSPEPNERQWLERLARRSETEQRQLTRPIGDEERQATRQRRDDVNRERRLLQAIGDALESDRPTDATLTMVLDNFRTSLEEHGSLLDSLTQIVSDAVSLLEVPRKKPEKP